MRPEQGRRLVARAPTRSKGFGVTLLTAETTGAVSPAFDALLRRYSRLSRAPGTTDHTRYGISPSSPRDFHRHHLAAHSAAVGHADAVVLLKQEVTHTTSPTPRAGVPQPVPGCSYPR